MRTLVLVLVLLTAGGCFRPRGEEPEPVPPKIEIRSRFIGPVVVYLLVNGNSNRIGMIPSNRRQTFDFPVGVNPFGSSLNLVADPIGEFESYTSDAFSISPGATVVLTIETELRYSNIVIVR